MTKPYHEQLKIERPTLAALKDHREASACTLMIVALIEHGGPLTLEEVAERIERAGARPAGTALQSLKRCRPARPPIYRHSDMYELDVHSDELDLWLFRLGLRGPDVPALQIVRKESAGLLSPDVPLSPEEIERAFRDENLWAWSAQRLALAILDAHGRPMRDEEVVGALNRLTRHHPLREDSARWWRAMAIDVGPNRVWRIVPGHPALPSARRAVRERLQALQRWACQGPDPAVLAAYQKRAEERRATRAADFARMRRILLHAFPVESPAAVVWIDLATGKGSRWIQSELDDLRKRLASYDFIGAFGVHSLLRALGVDPSQWHVAELGPPQKTLQIGGRMRTLRITNEMLVRGSCGIPRPLGTPVQMWGYLYQRQTTKLMKRLQADATAVLSLYRYGRLHGAYRLRRGFLDCMLPVPWVHRDEPTLRHLMIAAMDRGLDLEVVAGPSPDWNDPWARSFRCQVRTRRTAWEIYLIDEDGIFVNDRDVQAARLCEP